MATMKLGSKPEVFQLDGCTWVCKNELVSDIIIEVGEVSFHLHKFPLLNKCGLLQKMMSDFHSEDGSGCALHLHDLPGGAKSFELIAKFCYDIKMELNALNVVTLRCAAEYLRMTEDYVGGNLILHTEKFLDEVFGNWKDSIKVLETCEFVLLQAEELHIVTRCINSLASKACADPSVFGWPVGRRSSMKNPEDGVIWNGICPSEKSSSVGGDWWYEDVSFLSLPLYKRLISAMDSKGMNPQYIAGSLMFYAKRFLPGLTRVSSFRECATNWMNPCTSVSTPTERDQRAHLEEIVALIPMKKDVMSTKFLLRLLRTAMILHASSLCLESLEKRVGAQMDEAALEDILIPNLGYSGETLYDVDCVQRILEHFMMSDQPPEALTSPGIVEEGQLTGCTPSLTPMTMVAKLMDGYLAEVAPDVNLKFPKFQLLASAIPDYARHLHDGIYRAIDIYLKSHPWLTDSEREQLCRLMNCQKLSLEACMHAAQNERLPLRVVVQVLFFEQLRLRTSLAGTLFDDMENSHSSHTGIIPEGKENEQLLDVDEMRERVSELEKECMKMKKEIENLGKPKNNTKNSSSNSTWAILSKKFGFGLKSLSTKRDK